MRTLLLCTLLLVLETASSQIIQLKDSRFTLLSAFQSINNNNKKQMYQLALAKYKIGNQSGYAVLVENHVADFRFDLIDTTELELTLEGYILRQRGSKTWLEDQSLTFKKLDVVPASNSKGIVVAFALTNEEAYDLKKDFLRGMKLYGATTSENLSIDEPAKSLFIKNAAKITATKGSFDDLGRFKANKLPFYSLMYKTDEAIAQKLGAAVKTKDGPMATPTSIVKFYETEFANYEIVFEEGKAYDIRLKPRLKIKFSEYSFYTTVNGYPFELTGCNCGESIAEEDGDRIIFKFRNKKQHEVTFSRQNENDRRTRYLTEVRINDF